MACRARHQGPAGPPAPWSPHHLCMPGSRHSRASAGLEAPACCQDLVHLFSGTKPLGEKPTQLVPNQMGRSGRFWLSSLCD